VPVSVEFGQEVPIDFCEECAGQGWVRLATSFPSDDFPEPNAGTSVYGYGSMAYSLEVGIARPHDVPDDGEPLSPEQRAETTRLQMADMSAMRRAICRCLARREFVLGSYESLRLGGVIDGRWPVTVRWIEGDE
jgi:hypothetical protein